MELKRKGGRTKTMATTFTIREAVSADLDGPQYYEGVAENAQSVARSAVEFVARLTELLHKRGSLLDDDVLELLPMYEEYRGAPKND